MSFKSIDIIGIVLEVTKQEAVKLKSGAEKVRKYVTLCDETNCTIAITLWGELCERINPDRG